jgi:hypothetical protein
LYDDQRIGTTLVIVGCFLASKSQYSMQIDYPEFIDSCFLYDTKFPVMDTVNKALSPVKLKIGFEQPVDMKKANQAVYWGYVLSDVGLV